jgi:hypothetical protein
MGLNFSIDARSERMRQAAVAYVKRNRTMDRQGWGWGERSRGLSEGINFNQESIGGRCSVGRRADGQVSHTGPVTDAGSRYKNYLPRWNSHDAPALAGTVSAS